MNGLRILWKSNAPHVGSGYGVQANSLLPRLAQHPSVEEIGIFGYYGVMGGLTELTVGAGIPGVQSRLMAHYPVSQEDGWGNDIVWDHAKHFDANVIITLMDAWVLKPDYGYGGFLWVPYAPVDHEPIPDQVLDRLRRAYHPLAYSQHAAREFTKAGLDHHYIPHGVETKIYKPYDKGGKLQMKQWLGLDPDTFLIGAIGANKGWPSRKGYPELLEAFSIFHGKRPDARLFIHAEFISAAHGGLRLPELARLYGVSDHVHISTQYLRTIGLTPRDMCQVYNAFDVFCLPSMGEGFGIPIIEAQACGVPVIVTDWTACTELCGAGLAVPIAKKIPTPLMSFQAYADVGALVAAMEAIYQAWKDQAAYDRLRTAAREFAMKYDWDLLVREQWFPFIDWLWERVQIRTIQRPRVPLDGVVSSMIARANAGLHPSLVREATP